MKSSKRDDDVDVSDDVDRTTTSPRACCVSAKLQDANSRKLASRNAAEMTPGSAGTNIKDVRGARGHSDDGSVIYRRRRR